MKMLRNLVLGRGIAAHGAPPTFGEKTGFFLRIGVLPYYHFPNPCFLNKRTP